MHAPPAVAPRGRAGTARPDVDPGSGARKRQRDHGARAGRIRDHGARAVATPGARAYRLRTRDRDPRRARPDLDPGDRTNRQRRVRAGTDLDPLTAWTLYAGGSR